jgi:hypothetical protein
LPARHYSIIIILGRGGILHLPQLGFGLHLKPGDVVCFLASQQLHRLEADPDGPFNPPLPEQQVITIWTDRQTSDKIVQTAEEKRYEGF